MSKIIIKQVRSSIGRPSNQKKTLTALGLRKIGQIVEKEDCESIKGMVNTVKHLVKVLESNKN